MVHLVTSLAFSENKRRNDEFSYALTKNLNNPLVDSVHIVTEDSRVLSFKSPKTHINITDQRPTFKTLVDYIGANIPPDTIVALTNSDIFFDDTLSLLDFQSKLMCYCLTRWDPPIDIDNSDTIAQAKWWSGSSANLSFDTYVFKTPLSVSNVDFHVGVLGCDNRFAYELMNSGLLPVNPSKLVRSFHVHASEIRTYNKDIHLSGNYLRLNLTDDTTYNPDNVAIGWLDYGHVSVWPKDWDWLPRVTDEEFFTRPDIPDSMREYYPRDRNGRIRKRHIKNIRRV
jgi:hypothetical protein